MEASYIEGTAKKNGQQAAVQPSIHPNNLTPAPHDALLDALGCGLLVFTENKIRFANQLAHQLLGYAPGSLEGLQIDAVFTGLEKEQHQALEQLITQVIRDQVMLDMPKHLVVKGLDNQPIPISGTLTPYSADCGQSFIVTFKEIATEKKQSFIHSMSTAVLDALNPPFLIFRLSEPSLPVLFISEPLRLAFQLTPDQDDLSLLTMPIKFLESDTLTSVKRRLLKNDVYRNTLLAMNRLGEILPYEATFFPIREDDPVSSPTLGILSITANSSDEASTQKDIKPLLENFSSMSSPLQIRHAYQRAVQSGPWVGLLITHFTRPSVEHVTNTHEGEAFIDHVLRRLKQQLRKPDAVIHLNHDNMLIVLAGQSSQEKARLGCERVSQHIIDTFAEPLEIDEAHHVIKTSIGLALHHPDDGPISTRIKQGFQALDQANQQATHHYEWFHGQANKLSASSAALRLALLETDFTQCPIELAYHPHIDLKNHRISALEVLARWRSPDGKLFNGYEIVKLAKKSGLLLQMDLQVIQTLCKTLSDWHRLNQTSTTMVINMGPALFWHAHSAKQILTLLDPIVTPKTSLILELDARELSRDPFKALEQCETLFDQGFRLSLSNIDEWSHVVEFLDSGTFESAKLAPHIVQHIPTSAARRILLEAIIHALHALNMRVIASGIESKAVLDELVGFGCNEAQGYLFTKPLSAQEAAAQLTKGLQ